MFTLALAGFYQFYKGQHECLDIGEFSIDTGLHNIAVTEMYHRMKKKKKQINLVLTRSSFHPMILEYFNNPVGMLY